MHTASNRNAAGAMDAQPRRSVLYWAMLLIVQAIFLVCAWLAVLIFQAFNIAQIIGTWTWLYGPNDLWERFRTLLVIPYKMDKPEDGHTILGGWENLYLIFYFWPVVIAFVCYTIYSVLPNKSPLHARVGKTLRAAWAPVWRVLTWQLPLRSWWLYCCSGLNVAEAVLWGGWVAVQVCGTWDLLRYFESSRLVGWNTLGISHYVPHSVLRLEDISIAIAWVIYMNTAMLFFPIAHSSFLNRMLGLPYGALVRFHRWIGHFTMWTTLLHGVFYYAYWIADPTVNFWSMFFDWGDHYAIVSFAGTLALVFGMLLWFTSINYVRRNFFKVFYYCHIFGFIGYLVFALIHYWWGWIGLFPSLFLWGADLVVRSYYAQKGCHIHSYKLSADGDLVELQIAVEKGTFNDTTQLAGAHIFLKVPAVSRLDYHPFSIMGASKDPVTGATLLTVIIKKYNRWSKDLMEVLRRTNNALPVRIWRPFDSMEPTEHWEQFSSVVMVAGGVAVTPMVALLHDLMSARAERTARVPGRVLLLFSARHTSEFSALDARILQEAAAGDWLEVRVYHTGRGGGAVQAGKGDPALPDDDKMPGAHPEPKLEVAKSHSLSDGSWDGAPATATGKASKAAWSLVRAFLPMDFVSDRQFVWVCLLAYFGGFMGIVMAQAATMEMVYMTDFRHDTYWLAGLVTAAVVCVQAVGLPALFVVFPSFCWRAWRRWRGERAEAAVPMREEFSTSLNAESRTLVSHEGGGALRVHAGRPDIDAAITAAVESGRMCGSGRVAVVSGGPDPLMHAVSLCVAKLNDQLTAPAVVLHQVAHTL